jgi:hypothetical protein
MALWHAPEQLFAKHQVAAFFYGPDFTSFTHDTQERFWTLLRRSRPITASCPRGEACDALRVKSLPLRSFDRCLGGWQPRAAQHIFCVMRPLGSSSSQPVGPDRPEADPKGEGNRRRLVRHLEEAMHPFLAYFVASVMMKLPPAGLWDRFLRWALWGEHGELSYC